MSSVQVIYISNHGDEKLYHYELQNFRSSVGLAELKHHVFLYKMYDSNKGLYRAFCSANIISSEKVLTSAHCLLSNKKKLLKKLNEVYLVGGSLTAIVKQSPDTGQQWRNIVKVYSQQYFRFPAFGLAVLIVDTPWDFNNTNVDFIPMASVNYDFDGVCSAAAVRTVTSWESTKVLFLELMHIIKKSNCEIILQRNCRLFYCTAYGKENPLAALETEGGGLVCHGTGDPEELDHRGVLVGVTTLINTRLPTLHNRVGIFRQWILDSASTKSIQKEIIVLCAILILIQNM